jgi:hypothetical protein
MALVLEVNADFSVSTSNIHSSLLAECFCSKHIHIKFKDQNVMYSIGVFRRGLVGVETLPPFR